MYKDFGLMINPPHQGKQAEHRQATSTSAVIMKMSPPLNSSSRRAPSMPAPLFVKLRQPTETDYTYKPSSSASQMVGNFRQLSGPNRMNGKHQADTSTIPRNPPAWGDSTEDDVNP